MPYADVEVRRQKSRERYKTHRASFLKQCADRRIRDMLRWKGETPLRGVGQNYNPRGQEAQHYIAQLKSKEWQVFDTGLGACPFDLVLKNGDKQALVLVSTKFVIQANEKVRELAIFLGMELLIIHVKPDLSWFCETVANGKLNYTPNRVLWKKEVPQDWVGYKDGRRGSV